MNKAELRQLKTHTGDIRIECEYCDEKDYEDLMWSSGGVTICEPCYDRTHRRWGDKR